MPFVCPNLKKIFSPLSTNPIPFHLLIFLECHPLVLLLFSGDQHLFTLYSSGVHWNLLLTKAIQAVKSRAYSESTTTSFSFHWFQWHMLRDSLDSRPTMIHKKEKSLTSYCHETFVWSKILMSRRSRHSIGHLYILVTRGGFRDNL